MFNIIEQGIFMNTRTAEKDIITAACRKLQDETRIKTTWTPWPKNAPAPADAVVTAYPATTAPVEFAAEVKPNLTTQTVITLNAYKQVTQTRKRTPHAKHPPLIVARYVNPNIADHLRDLQINYMDTAGNAYLRGAGLLVDIQGRRAEQPPEKARKLGARPLQLVALILAHPEFLNKTAREQAAAAGIALGSVTGTLQELEARALVRRAAADRCEIANYPDALELWVRGYAEVLRPKLLQKRYRLAPGVQVAELPEALKKAGCKHMLTGGEAAAAVYTQFLEPAGATLHLFNPAEQLPPRLLLPDARGNIDVLKGFGRNPEVWRGEPRELIHPLIVYADLLAMRANDRRLLATADLLLQQLLRDAGERF